MRAVDRRVRVPRIGQIVGLTGAPPPSDYPRGPGLSVRRTTYPGGFHLSARRSLPFCRSENSPSGQSDHFFAFEMHSRRSAGDSARIRSGFAFREKDHRSRQITEIFCKTRKYLLSSWRQGGVSDAAWRPFRFFFCAFSRPARMSDRPRAGDPSMHRPARRAPLHDARSRPASGHGASASMDSEAAILRWLEPDETGACLSRGRAGFSRPRALVVPRARPTTTGASRFERAAHPLPSPSPVASLPQAPRSSRAC
jgi:hypothetical protein